MAERPPIEGLQDFDDTLDCAPSYGGLPRSRGGSVDWMVERMVARMQGPARAYEEAVFPCLRKGDSRQSTVELRDGAVVVTAIAQD